MDWFNKIKNAKIATPEVVEAKSASAQSEQAQQKFVKGWHADQYEVALIQRNALFMALLACVVVIAFSALAIRYLKSTRSIEPFVIEIERKTGVPTVVDPLTDKAFTGDEAIKRYFVMQYIKAREEYYQNLFNKNYSLVTRVLSSPEVYGTDYRPKFNVSNPQSPFNILGNRSWRQVFLKSIIFRTPSSAQVRISLQTDGAVQNKQDKVIYIEFEFQDLKMNEEERLINPLGFVVTKYRIEDELQ